MATPSHRRIKLTYAFQRDFVANVHDVFRLTIAASDGHLMPNAIFAYLQEPLQPGEAEMVDVFDHVCSPVDLQDYPVNAPRVNAVPPWFRCDSVDIEVPTREQGLEALHAIVGDVTSLVFGMNAADVLVDQPPIWIGFQPGDAGGSSIGSEGSLN